MKPLLESETFHLNRGGALPEQMRNFPRFRYMGSKFRLLPWIHDTLQELDFETVTDAFSGSGVVSYLLKGMGKQVRANDTLAFPSVLTAATVANSATRLDAEDLEFLLSTKARRSDEKFIQHTYKGIFYTQPELEFLDDFWVGIREMESPFKRSVALAAILRSAIKRLNGVMNGVSPR